MNVRYALAPEPRSPYCGPDGMWSRADLVRLLVPEVLGGAGLAYAWYRSARESQWRDNSPWIVLGFGSVALAGLGILWWLIVGSARLATSRRLVRAGLEGRFPRPSIEVTLPQTDAERVTSPRSRRYHRPSCLLMQGKVATPVDVSRCELTPCAVCEA